MHEKTLVRTYANWAHFMTDEQKLGRQGWSVASTVRPDQQPGVIARLRARFTGPQAAARIVVTYTRGQPS